MPLIAVDPQQLRFELKKTDFVTERIQKRLKMCPLINEGERTMACEIKRPFHVMRGDQSGFKEKSNKVKN